MDRFEKKLGAELRARRGGPSQDDMVYFHLSYLYFHLHHVFVVVQLVAEHNACSVFHYIWLFLLKYIKSRHACIQMGCSFCDPSTNTSSISSE
jgi:hypothetical protein